MFKFLDVVAARRSPRTVVLTALPLLLAAFALTAFHSAPTTLEAEGFGWISPI